MDLNIENYSVDEMLDIFHIDVASADLTQEFLYSKLQAKIAKLRSVDINETSEISENKAQLVDFFYQCFIQLNKLVEKKQKNTLIVQDDHNIIKHKETKKEEIFQVNVKSGLINPLTIKTYKKVLNIDTRFRDNYETSRSTDFVINLPTAFKKVLSLQVVNYQLPYTIYSISKKTGSHSFYVDTSLIEINDGGYDENSLVQEINSKLPSDISLIYNSLSAKFIFTSVNVFSLNFDYIENADMYYNIATNIDKNQMTLGWIMGFRNSKIVKNGKQTIIKYVGAKSYEAENCYDGGLFRLLSSTTLNDTGSTF
jgi:hypothetical protein